MSDIKVSSIAAMAENKVIGRDGELPWHIAEDLKHFKRTTMGKPIIMGRKSYESLGKPLPGRPNFVISRNQKSVPTQPTAHYGTMEAVAHDLEAQVQEGPFLYVTIEDAINAAKDTAQELGLDEIFITGGGEIYRQTMDVIDRLYLTIVHADIEGDTVFPEFDRNQWETLSEESHDGDPAFTFLTLERKE